MVGPLDGIRVVDVTGGAQGPWAGALLADLGADVTKIEPPGGEMMRRGTRSPSKKGHPLATMGLNHGKRCIVLDLKARKDMEIALKLVERADVFLENWRAGVAKRLGLGYEELSKINPRIVFASGSGYGFNNRYASKGCIDVTAQGMSGMASISGPIGGPGERARFTVLDLTTPLPIVQGIVFALIAREQTGVGQWVQCSQTETSIVMQAVRMAEYFATGEQPQPLGTASPNIVPSQAFKTRDSYVDVDVLTQEDWEKLCHALHLEDLISDSRFASNAKRVEHRTELIPILEGKFPQATTEKWLKVLVDHDVPVAPVLWSVKELYSNPQIMANELIMTKEHPEAGPVRVPALPWVFSRTPAQFKWVAPAAGAHQEEVLRELGIFKESATRP